MKKLELTKNEERALSAYAEMQRSKKDCDEYPLRDAQNSIMVKLGLYRKVL